MLFLQYIKETSIRIYDKPETIISNILPDWITHKIKDFNNTNIIKNTTVPENYKTRSEYEQQTFPWRRGRTSLLAPGWASRCGALLPPPLGAPEAQQKTYWKQFEIVKKMFQCGEGHFGRSAGVWNEVGAPLWCSERRGQGPKPSTKQKRTPVQKNKRYPKM